MKEETSRLSPVFPVPGLPARKVLAFIAREAGPVEGDAIGHFRSKCTQRSPSAAFHFFSGMNHLWNV